MRFQLRREAWRDFKTHNNLSKSSIFNKADVGPHIDAWWSAYDQYKKSKNWKTFRPLVTKLTDLQKAFTKFIALKEAMDEFRDHPEAKQQILTWQEEVDEAIEKFRAKGLTDESKLRTKGVKDLDDVLSDCGI